MSHEYVHGYSGREKERLNDQSRILERFLHHDTKYGHDEHVLEAGCGVGAQSAILSRRSPDTRFAAIDISDESLAIAKARDLSNFEFRQADIMNLPFPDHHFDHVFICFVLEHLENPRAALVELKRVLKPGGTLTVIEGDHGSCFWHPETEDSIKVWRCLIRVQYGLKHDPNIGRRLYPLIDQAGFAIDDIRPAWLYADAADPDLLDGMVNYIIVPMVKGAREASLKQKLSTPSQWDKGIAELERSGSPPEGTFFYTWFKAVARKR